MIDFKFRPLAYSVRGLFVCTLVRMHRTLPLLVLALMLNHCVDPTVPEYDYATGFLLVDGRITNEVGESRVQLSRSAVQFGDFVLSPLRSARVYSVGDGEEAVEWKESGAVGTFVPPDDLVLTTGRDYHIRIETAEGEVIESVAEELLPVVPIQRLQVTFDQEAYFSTELDRFVPAFSLLADVNAPGEQDNFYQFRHRTFERTGVCATCFQGVYRRGECVRDPSVDFYDYLCDRTCWRIDRSQRVTIFSDQLSAGSELRNVLAGQVVYNGSGGMLAVVEMAAISPAAYTYLEQLVSLTEASGGLNAPLPAPLYGNLRDRSDQGTNVLGYVSVAALSTERIYWARDSYGGTPLIPPRGPQTEPLAPAPPSAPCSGPNLTDQQPEGWPN